MASGRRKAAELVLPGIANNWATTPDSAAISVVGDLDLRIYLAHDSWRPAGSGMLLSKIHTDGQSSYDFNLLAAGGIQYRWTPTGANAGIVTKGSTGAIPTALAGQRLWLRVTHDVDNGAAGNDVKFWTSTDGVTWTQLGTTATTAGVTSIFDGTNQLGIGANANGVSNLLTARVALAQVRTGIDGPIVAEFDASRATPGATTVGGSAGETWTINTSGATQASLQ